MVQALEMEMECAPWVVAADGAMDCPHASATSRICNACITDPHIILVAGEHYFFPNLDTWRADARGIVADRLQEARDLVAYLESYTP